MFQSLKERIRGFVGKTEEVAEKEIKLSKETKIKGMLKKKIKLSEKDLESILDELQLDLIQNDVAVEITDIFLQELKEKLTDKEIEKNDLDSFIKNSLRETLLDVLKPGEEIDLLKLIEG